MNQRGSTLVEVLVSAGLLLLILNFVFHPLQQALRSSTQAKLRLQALSIAQDLLYQARADIVVPKGNFTGEQIEGWGQGRNLFTYEVVFEAAGDNLTRVLVTVFWDDKRLTLGSTILTKESTL